MPMVTRWMLWRRLLRIRPSLLLLLAFVVLLGLVNCLMVNQRAVLNLFYIPVVFAAWWLPTRDAVGVAALAGLMVVAYAVFIPGQLDAPANEAMVWADLSVWAGILVVTAYMVSRLRAATERAMQDLQNAYSGVLSILSKFIQTVDADTEAHSVRVSGWSVRIARALGLPAREVEETRIAGLIHDVGKVAVSVDLLRKAAALSDAERIAIEEHTTHGAALVKPVGGMLANIADAVEAHHEKFDGSGYMGLSGERIPLPARIIAVADAFDALLSDRPYRKGVGLFEAMDTIVAASGSHFDPDVVRALNRIVDRDGEAAVAAVAQGAAEVP